MIAKRFKRIGLIGAGLIGGSIAAALARELPGASLLILDASTGNANYVAERHPNAEVVATVDALSGCDAIFVATPVASIAAHVVSLLNLRDSEAIIIDTGSAKTAIIDEVAGAGIEMGRFIPGHPLAGGISTGPGRSVAGIVSTRPFVLTPTDATAESALKSAVELLDTIGASTVVMDASAHDQLLARGSHLPHLIAFAMAEFADEGVQALLPASFRSIAEFARSDPQMWSDIFRANGADLRAAVDSFKKRLDILVDMADEPSPEQLLATLQAAKARIDALEND
jgi:prephenate dehydrogenase